MQNSSLTLINAHREYCATYLYTRMFVMNIVLFICILSFVYVVVLLYSWLFSIEATYRPRLRLSVYKSMRLSK